VDGRDIHRGRIDAEQWGAIASAAESIRVGKETVLFSQCVGGTDVDACAAISRMSARGAKLIAVDYLGVLSAAGRAQDRRNELRVMLSRLKAHAGRCGVALVLVSQITRPTDKNPNKQPTKHDLKESGDLENGAELIIGLWRDEEHDHAPVRARILKSKIGGNGVEWMMQRSRHSGRLRVVGLDEVESWK
jgi:replicative DNA helicase